MPLKIAISLLLSAFLFPTQALSQEFDLEKLEAKIQAVVTRVRPATVAVRTPDGDASGVIVSKEGHVLTAGHCVMEPGTKFTIELPDGREFAGVGMGLDIHLDCGLIKITDQGEWPFVELGWSSDLKTNQPCISLGHSHGFNPDRGPVVRFGRIVNPISKLNGYIQSSCLMEPGDSGGPLFDLNGRLIGIHTQCGEVLSENFEVPVDAFRRYWNQLNEAKVFQSFRTKSGPNFGMSLPRGGGMSENGFGSASTSVKIRRVTKEGWADQQGIRQSDRIKMIANQRVVNAHQARLLLYRSYLLKEADVEMEVSREGEPLTITLNFTQIETTEPNPIAVYPTGSTNANQPIAQLENLVEVVSDLESKLDDHCVRVASDLDGQTRMIQGTALAIKGQTLVLCKRSMIGDAPKLFCQGKACNASIVLEDSQNDVALLSTSRGLDSLNPIQLTRSESTGELGEFLISASFKNKGRIGVRGAFRFSNKATGFLGVVFEDRDDAVILKEILENTAADAAGLKIGDQIIVVADEDIDSPRSMIEAISQYSAGDRLELTVIREDQKQRFPVALGTRDEEEAPEGFQHAAELFQGGKSKIRTGFQQVIPQDASIEARECGGPVFDTDGNFVGINIARFSRTQSYILPQEIIRSIFTKAIAGDN